MICYGLADRFGSAYIEYNDTKFKISLSPFVVIDTFQRKLTTCNCILMSFDNFCATNLVIHNLQFAVLDKDEKEIITYSNDRYDLEKEDNDFIKVLNSQTLKAYQSQDMVCFRIKGNVSSSFNENSKRSNSSFFENLQFLLKQGRQLCDCTIQLNNTTTIHTYSTILAAASPVFAQMFLTPVSEQKEKCIDFTNDQSLDLQTMLRFLLYLYCNNLIQKWDPSTFVQQLTLNSSIDVETQYIPPSTYQEYLLLYLLAQKFQVLSLKELCEEHILNYVQTLPGKELIALYDKLSLYNSVAISNAVRKRIVTARIKNLQDQIQKLEQCHEFDENCHDDRLLQTLDKISATNKNEHAYKYKRKSNFRCSSSEDEEAE